MERMEISGQRLAGKHKIHTARHAEFWPQICSTRSDHALLGGGEKTNSIQIVVKQFRVQVSMCVSQC